MATVTLSIPSDLMRVATSRLGGRGQARVKQYLLSSLQCLADDRLTLSPEAIRELMDGARSQSLRATDDYWNRKIRNYNLRNGRRSSKRKR